MPFRQPYAEVVSSSFGPRKIELEPDLQQWLNDMNIRGYSKTWQKWTHDMGTSTMSFYRVELLFLYMKDAILYKLAWGGKP